MCWLSVRLIHDNVITDEKNIISSLRLACSAQIFFLGFCRLGH